MKGTKGQEDAEFAADVLQGAKGEGGQRRG
jgi:hypothetical protein